MGSNISGDAVPFTPMEQFYASFITAVSRVYIALLYAEVSNLMSNHYGAYIDFFNKTNVIVDWLRYNEGNKKVTNRIQKYREMIWDECKGIDDQILIMDMPETLRKKTQLAMLHAVIDKVNIFPKNDKGAIYTMIQCLDIKMLPKGEIIIYEGEIVLEMYIIIKGYVLNNIARAIMAALVEVSYWCFALLLPALVCCDRSALQLLPVIDEVHASERKASSASVV